MALVKPPPHHDVRSASEAMVVSYCELCFSPLSSSLFHNSASFALFFSLLRVDGCGGGGWVLDFTAIAACFQHERGHVCGSGQGVSVALVKYTSPLHKSQQLWSLPKMTPKRLFWNKFSTLDVSCSVPLCSIGSYFGEAWVLLSNLLSRLQMKVSGGATHKKLLLLFWSGQIIIFFFFLTQKTVFCPSVQPTVCLVEKRLSSCLKVTNVQPKWVT